MNTQTIGASDKQIAFAKALLSERTDDVDAAIQRATDKGWLATTKMCSAWIDQIKAQPKTVQAPAREFVDAGFYLMDGSIFKVVPSRSTGRHYAMTLDAPGVKKGKWSYAKGAMFSLTADHRLSLEQAKAHGTTHGYCIACGALLTDPESVAAGIGPVCAAKF